MTPATANGQKKLPPMTPNSVGESLNSVITGTATRPTTILSTKFRGMNRASRMVIRHAIFGWNGFSFEVVRDQLYWGGDGVLAKADQVGAYSDAGIAITASSKQAFNYFGGRGRNVQVHLMRPIFSTDGVSDVALGVDVDYGDNEPTVFLQTGAGGGDPWGGIWDVTWSGAAVVLRDWRTVQGFGSAIAPRLRARTDDVQMTWAASDFVYENASFGP